MKLHASPGNFLRKPATAAIGLASLLLLAVLVSASVGAVPLPLPGLFSLAAGHTAALDQTQRAILFSVRLPRVLASAVVGAALGAAGLLFQGLFRNPMADPYVIGASGGAGLGACLAIVFFPAISFLGFSAAALAAFAGALLALAAVYALARTRGRTGPQTRPVTLLLAGFAVGVMLSNSAYLIEMLDPTGASQRVVEAWLRGAITIPAPGQLAVAAVLLAAGLVAAYPLTRRLDTLALGDDYAEQLGVRVEATRAGVIVVGSLLTALAVSLGGLIGFAGLIVPHVARLLIGPSHPRLLPVVALAGALFLVVADTLARTLFRPAEIPVGILMVFVGGPFFLYLLRKARRGYAL